MLPSTLRSSAAFEGSLREVELVKAEAAWDFGIQQPSWGVGEKRVPGCDLPLQQGGEGPAKLPLGLSLARPCRLLCSAVPSDGGTMGFTPAVAQDGVVLPKQ